MESVIRSSNLGELDGAGIVGLVDGVAAWSQALQGQAPFKAGLAQLAAGFGASVAVLTKAERHVGGGLRAFVSDPAAETSRVETVERSFADIVIGAYLPSARVGTVWHASMVEDDRAGALRSFHARRKLAECVILTLGREDRWIHLLELHFPTRLNAQQNALLTALSGTLCRLWSHRAAGLFSEALLQRQTPRPNVALAAPILSDENPARLSRAEFRVCMLLSNGLSRARLLEELAISATTLRTHLRQICAKTGCENQADLLHRLMVAAHRPAQARIEARLAMGA